MWLKKIIQPSFQPSLNNLIIIQSKIDSPDSMFNANTIQFIYCKKLLQNIPKGSAENKAYVASNEADTEEWGTGQDLHANC